MTESLRSEAYSSLLRAMICRLFLHAPVYSVFVEPPGPTYLLNGFVDRGPALAPCTI